MTLTPKAKIFISSLVLVCLLFANYASADLVQCGGYTDTGSKEPECTLPMLLNTLKNIINFLFSWAWLFSLIFIVYGGIRMVIAGGNEEAVSKAKTILSHAIIGFIIILLSFVIINFVIGFMTGGQISGQSLIDAFKLVP